MAVTRAQALLIIVGNPTVLSIDPLWRKFLNYIHSNRGWKGENPTWDPELEVPEAPYAEEISEEAKNNMEDFSCKATTRTLKDLSPDPLFEEDVGPLADFVNGFGNEDRPWRDVE